MQTLYPHSAGLDVHKKTIVAAVVHALLKIAYVLIQRDEDYKELGGNYFDTRQPAKTVQNLLSRLSQLGYDATLTPKTREQAA